MSEEFPEPTDLRAICSALEHFSLPAALCSLEDNKLVVWNQLFQKGSGLSEDELAQTGLSSLILLDETYGGSILENGHPTHVVRFVPCVLKNSLFVRCGVGRGGRTGKGYEASARSNRRRCSRFWRDRHATRINTRSGNGES
jgi:hypothetical protein